MSELTIKKYPDPILRKKNERVDKATPEMKKLTKDMIETMQKADGVGLAAPQIGISKKIIVVQTENGPSVFFNPKIIKKSKASDVEEEGCLSLPSIAVKVKRAKKIEVEVLNERGEKLKIMAEDMPARIFQHEIDHLNGILIIHKIPFWRRWKIMKNYKLKN